MTDNIDNTATMTVEQFELAHKQLQEAAAKRAEQEKADANEADAENSPFVI